MTPAKKKGMAWTIYIRRKVDNFKLENMFCHFAGTTFTVTCSDLIKKTHTFKHPRKNILEIPLAIVSNIGEKGVNVIYSANCQNEAPATGDMTLLGSEAKLHNYSLELFAS